MSIPLSAAAHERLRDLVISLSLGNLVVLRRWYDIERLQALPLDYFRLHPPSNILLYATLIAFVLFSTGFWLLGLLVRRIGKPWLTTVARVVFLAVLILPIETIRQYWNYQVGRADWGSNLSLVAMDLLLVAGMVGVLRGHLRILQAAVRATAFMVLFLPVFLIYFAGMHAEMEPSAAYHTRPNLPLLPSRTRVLR